MFTKTIAAVKKAEDAAQEELDALFVPYDPKTGSGGVHWNASGSSILTNALRGLTGLREDLEKRQAPIDEAAKTAADRKSDAVAAAQAQVDQANAALDAAKALPDKEPKQVDAEVVSDPHPEKLGPGEEWDATQAALDRAKAEGIDIATIVGTGAGGTVILKDVEAAIAAKETAKA